LLHCSATMMKGFAVAKQLLKVRMIPHKTSCATYYGTKEIGNREVVGFGVNGSATYCDMENVPLPAIRFRPETPDSKVLHDKEKGDWKKLSVEEKKALYRHSFCSTFAEMSAPTGEWKTIVGQALFGISLALWIYVWMKFYVYPPLPTSFSYESKMAQLKRQIDMHAEPIDGLTSQWDYDRMKWKWQKD